MVQMKRAFDGDLTTDTHWQTRSCESTKTPNNIVCKMKQGI